MGSTQLIAWARKTKKKYKRTIFDSYAVVMAFKKSQFSDFYKIVPAKENMDLVKKYRVRQDNTVVFCAPNGEMVACLAGMQCTQTNVLKVLKAWRQVYQAWQRKHAAK